MTMGRDAIERARNCACGGRPAITVGARMVRVGCAECGIYTKPSHNEEKAVERWNAGKAYAFTAYEAAYGTR